MTPSEASEASCAQIAGRSPPGALPRHLYVVRGPGESSGRGVLLEPMEFEIR